ncbi:hypothetical protein FD12_GL001772 [Lentilactobacillus rapi DSM 19907 = JCM 15042]|uniref:Uncharacterized protein n=1 Tax=Lentilactobacillus rapi DSM 19907 = JCM 15042 TaxID=1423795 RepID=A0ABR5PF53_9LACO|nr:hypothetical protein FD12_GL001772 [Lentilactobacillus rapi DSM 19907 = JCM 15042]
MFSQREKLLGRRKIETSRNLIPEFTQNKQCTYFWMHCLFCLNGRDQPFVASFINIIRESQVAF